MTFVFGKASESRLIGLKPGLIAVNRRALSYGLMDFSVVQGVRTEDEQRALYAQGRELLHQVNFRRQLAGLAPITEKENSRNVTWTLKSNHLKQPDGFGHAYDVAPYFDGEIQWNNLEAFNFLATLHLRAALELGEPLEWGGHFSKNKDRPHFQLKKGT